MPANYAFERPGLPSARIHMLTRLLCSETFHTWIAMLSVKSALLRPLHKVAASESEFAWSSATAGVGAANVRDWLT